MGTQIFGIVNVTTDSFSDGGMYLTPDAAIAQALALRRAGADVIDLGPSSSHPDSESVSSKEEIRRVDPVIEVLHDQNVPVSIDSYLGETQLHCARRGVAFVNDIQGFGDPEVRTALARLDARLVVMHSMQSTGPATREANEVGAVIDSVYAFFERRVRELAEAGIARDRIVLDPGMGFFLSSSPEPSLAVLRELPKLNAEFRLPLLVSVSRKSFLGAIVERDVASRGAATLAAEIYAAMAGADYIRTHDVAALHDALAVRAALQKEPSELTSR